MTQFVGRSGADAVSGALMICCRVIKKYDIKIRGAIEITRVSGLISDYEASIAVGFVDAIQITCRIFDKVAANSGFTSG